MSWHIDVLPEQQLIRVVTSGILTLPMLQAFGQEAVATARANGCHKFLIDHRLLESVAVAALDIHELPDWYAAIGITAEHRIATLLAENALRREDFAFFHAQASNRGAHQFRLFDRLDEAQHWLAESN